MSRDSGVAGFGANEWMVEAGFYTHLTLPTIRILVFWALVGGITKSEYLTT